MRMLVVDDEQLVLLPPLDVPAADPAALFGAAHRHEVAGEVEASEVDVVRHFTRLSRLNFAIDTALYSLGSCTMKHNPRLNEETARLAGFADTTHPPVVPADHAEGPGWVVRSDVVPARIRLEAPAGPSHLTCDGEVVGWWLEEGERWSGPSPRGDAIELPGLKLQGNWDLVTVLERPLPADR